ncbi:hypothetical protein [Bradyrhizobium sp. CCBAU 51765]|uniref:hypothetical protein n=1 Tax=Bradyrhizobium sp. CCBAU 51765 TaxID=1325102 RepID=UPI0018889CED|nr:hypothetical protein [Bradyrhizobium sp. CCBAU 51765]
MSADQASEIARLRQENERLRMERDISKKPSPAQARLCAVETASADGIFSTWRVAAITLLEAQSPLKNVVHGCNADLRMVTLFGRRSRLGR